jgi:hypothetical protein
MAYCTSYLRNEFGDPNIFPVFTMGMFHKLLIWELSAHSQFPEKLLMNHLKINVIIGSVITLIPFPYNNLARVSFIFKFRVFFHI